MAKETPYIVWSRETVKEMEDLKLLPPARGGEVVVSDPAQVKSLLKFLQDHRSQAATASGKTDVRTNEKVLVHEIALEWK